jgi:hypothetical protein
VQTAPPAGPTTSGDLPLDINGTFATHINLSDVPEPDQAGDWFLTLTSTAGYQLGRVASGRVENKGDLAVLDGDQLRFSNEQGIGACPGPGVYGWVVDGDTLSLTKVVDGCAVRVAQNTSSLYRRCPGGADTCRDILP